jgi:hypothetical protein
MHSPYHMQPVGMQTQFDGDYEFITAYPGFGVYTGRSSHLYPEQCIFVTMGAPCIAHSKC